MREFLLSLLLLCVQSIESISQQGLLTMNKKVDVAMEFAKSNKAELQKVFNHYSLDVKDSLKLRAAYFLIANMTGHFSYMGHQKQGVDSLIRYLKQAKQVSGSDFWKPDTFIQLDKLWEEIMADAARKHTGQEFVFDNRAISADLLIENIEYAFKAWALPWSSHLNFDQFCKYVLPYRFYDEPLESWRPRYMKKFAWLAEAMGKSTDPVLACKLINESLQREFRFNRALVRYDRALGPNNLLDGGQGKCLDQAGLANFAMRSMGIPVELEVVSQWANRSLGHKFSGVMDKEGHFIAFMGAESAPYQTRLPYIAPKIYSIGYMLQNDSLLADRIESGTISADFECFLDDITREFISVSDLVITVTSGTVKPGERVYLCVFNNHDWIPVCSSLSSDGRSVSFKNMGEEVLYLPMVLRNKLIPVSSPMILQKDKSVRTVFVNKEINDSVLIPRKYPVSQTKLEWLGLISDGKFEGADSADFSDAKTLYTIRDPFYIMLNRRSVPQLKVRYLRYLFPKNSYGSLAEICFYGDSTLSLPLKGYLIHSPKVFDGDMQKAFDGNLGNYINTPTSSYYNNEWIGLDLGKEQNVAGVGFSPRNDENGIDPDMVYELFYWDNQWISLGAGTVTQDQETKLKFNKVPRGALLWLRNYSAGNEERIFLYENNAQQWW